MIRNSLVITALFGVCLVVSLAPLAACGAAHGSAFTNDGGRETGGASGGGGEGGSGGITLGGDAGKDGQRRDGRGEGGTGPACPPGLMCDVACTGKKTTTVTGKVYDPAMKNPLYNIAVYVPAVPLVALPKGVPTGADACPCGALFRSGALTNTSTAARRELHAHQRPGGR